MPEIEVYVGTDSDSEIVQPTVIQRYDPRGGDHWVAWGIIDGHPLAWYETHFGPLVRYTPQS